MKFQLLCLHCDDSLLLVDADFTIFERIPELYLSRTRTKLLPLGAKSTENLQFGNHKHCSMKTLRIREGNPAAWYSNNAPQPVITPNVLSQSIK
jgi:hypothetical protein